MEIPHIGGEEEEFQSSTIIEELLIPTQTESCVKYMTLCVSQKSEIMVEYLSKSIVVSQGG
jgi:hypothetical protein